MPIFHIDLENEYSTRFDVAKFMNFEGDFYDVLNSYFINVLKGLPSVGAYAVQTEEFKPDLLSYKIYGSTQYWWVLMVYNNLTMPSKIRNGMVINYPSLESLEDVYFVLAPLARSVV